MRPIRNRAKPLLRRRAPSAPWARSGPAWSFPEPGGRCRSRRTRAPTLRALPWPGHPGAPRPTAGSLRASPSPPGEEWAVAGSGSSAPREGARSRSHHQGQLGRCLVGRRVHVCTSVYAGERVCACGSLSRAAQAGRPREFIKGRECRWSGTPVGQRRESPRRRAPSRRRAPCAQSGPPEQKGLWRATFSLTPKP